jgi:hypothetical protein
VLRVVAATRTGGVVLCAGTRTIPYVDWIQDGMSMSSRLILHVTRSSTAELTRPRYAADIRLAIHVQDLGEFLSDIEGHRFSLVVIDADEVGKALASVMAQRVDEQSLLVGVGDAAAIHDMTRGLEDSHFACRLAGSLECVAFSRKGLQHRGRRHAARSRQVKIS